VIPLSILPAVNAALNATSALLLVVGYIFIRGKRIGPHKVAMVSAFVFSSLFLASYLYYHYHHGSTPFPAQGWVRTVYLAILFSHIVLAAAILPLALTTLHRASRGEFAKHMRIARWTLPLWLYVSITGVIIYWMLYRVEW
jgi:putative membrane protein